MEIQGQKFLMRYEMKFTEINGYISFTEMTYKNQKIFHKKEFFYNVQRRKIKAP